MLANKLSKFILMCIQIKYLLIFSLHNNRDVNFNKLIDQQLK